MLTLEKINLTTMDNSKIKVAIIGFGRMGGKYLDKFLKNGRYEVAYICDVNKEARECAAKLSPSSTIVADEQIVFSATLGIMRR